MGWFLYDRDLLHERFKYASVLCIYSDILSNLKALKFCSPVSLTFTSFEMFTNDFHLRCLMPVHHAQIADLKNCN